MSLPSDWEVPPLPGGCVVWVKRDDCVWWPGYVVHQLHDIVTTQLLSCDDQHPRLVPRADVRLLICDQLTSLLVSGSLHHTLTVDP